MTTNSRFPVALHILTALASRPNALMTSETIAASVCTNPVVIRRVLGDLRRAGIVESHAGNRGGWRLLHSPACITLRHVYEAVQEGLPFALAPQEPNQDCCIGKHMKATLTAIFCGAECALTEYLEQITIGDILYAVEKRQTANKE
jgi:Rrf2 family protein